VILMPKKRKEIPKPRYPSRGKNEKKIASSFRADSDPVNTQYSAPVTFDTALLFLFAGGATCCCICSKPSCCSELFPLRNCGAQCAGDPAERRKVQPVSVLITSISLRGYILLDPKSSQGSLWSPACFVVVPASSLDLTIS